MLRLTLAAAMAAALAGCATPPDADPSKGTTAPFYSCYRHINNSSGCPWTFKVDPNTQYGNVYFGDGTRSNCTQLNGPCTVPGNTNMEIHYTYTRGSAQGVFQITDQSGAEKKFNFVNPVVEQCPDIKHVGNTGAVAMNDPADGDMNAWGACTWADGESRPWPPKQSRPQPARR
jgi:hypothetical protein